MSSVSQHIRFLVLVGVVVVGTAMGAGTDLVHERKEVAGLAVVFGAEPEPALTEEMQYLRWRISSLADEKPYVDLEDAEVTVTFGGESYGPFRVRAVRRDPGLYQTGHIFTEVGEYGSLLRFRKGTAPDVHTVDFTFRIQDRKSLEIPKRKGGYP